MVALIVIGVAAFITIVSMLMWIFWLRNQTIKVGDARAVLISK